jgi:hypothetical protein
MTTSGLQGDAKKYLTNQGSLRRGGAKRPVIWPQLNRGLAWIHASVRSTCSQIAFLEEGRIIKSAFGVNIEILK